MNNGMSKDNNNLNKEDNSLNNNEQIIDLEDVELKIDDTNFSGNIETLNFEEDSSNNKSTTSFINSNSKGKPDEENLNQPNDDSDSNANNDERISDKVDDNSNGANEEKKENTPDDEERGGQTNSGEENKDEQPNQNEGNKNNQENQGGENKDNKEQNGQKDNQGQEGQNEPKDNQNRQNEQQNNQGQDNSNEAQNKNNQDNQNNQNNQSKDNKSDNPSNNENNKSNNNSNNNQKPNNENGKNGPSNGDKKDGLNNNKSSNNDRQQANKNRQNRRNPNDSGSSPNKSFPKNKNSNGSPRKGLGSSKKPGLGGGSKASNKASNAVKKAKETTKKVVSLLSKPTTWIILGVSLAVFLIIVIIPSIVGAAFPLVGGNVTESENYEKYSDPDKEVLDKLKTAMQKNPSGDAAYAMVATIYPYIEELQNGNVNAIRGKTNVEQTDETDSLDDNSSGETTTTENASSSDTTTPEEDKDIEDDNGDETDDDQYLKLLREKKYMKKFKKLLKESVKGDNDPLTDFLKKTWFGKDEGYKQLFDGVDAKEDLENAIIENLLDLIPDFKGYFYSDNDCSNSYNSVAGGQITLDYSGSVDISVGELLTKNILVDVKKNGCTSTGSLTSCESIYSSPITMQKYLYGVTLQEIGDYGVEKDKAIMIVEKSYAIGRAMERGNVVKIDDSTYVIGIIGSTRDQAYCNYEEDFSECSSGIKSISQTTLDNYSAAWEASKNIYSFNGNHPFGPYLDGKGTGGTPGETLYQTEVRDGYAGDDFKTIIYDQYRNKPDLQLVTVEGNYTSTEYGSSSTQCNSGCDGSVGIKDEDFTFWYQGMSGGFGDQEFCGSGTNFVSTGCGGVSYAILVANLTGNKEFSPLKANEEITGSGYCGASGTSDGLFTNTLVSKHPDFKVEDLEISSEGVKKAISALQNGALIVANVQANSPFTSTGHWIVIRSVTSDGTVKVADPASPDKSLKETYNINDFVREEYFKDSGGGNFNHRWFAVYGPKSNEIIGNSCSVAGANTNGQFDQNSRTSGTHGGQCIVYVQDRAIEIINSAKVGYENISDRSKYTSIWSEARFCYAKCALKEDCPGSSNCTTATDKAKRMKSLYNWSDDYTKPQAGAVIVWDAGGGSAAGHIAIIENVNDDGTVLVSQSNWCSNCETFTYNTLSVDQLKRYGTHDFIGYIYLLQPK